MDKVREKVAAMGLNEQVIPFSAKFETKLLSKSPEEAKEYLAKYFYILGLNLLLGAFSDQAVTALGLYYKWQTFFFIPLGALQTCMVPIVSFNYAARRLDRCRGDPEGLPPPGPWIDVPGPSLL